MAKKRSDQQNNELMIAVVVACFLGVALGFYMGKNSVDLSCPVTPVVNYPKNGTMMQQGTQATPKGTTRGY